MSAKKGRFAVVHEERGSVQTVPLGNCRNIILKGQQFQPHTCVRAQREYFAIVDLTSLFRSPRQAWRMQRAFVADWRDWPVPLHSNLTNPHTTLRS